MISKMKKFYLFFTGDPSDFLRELQREGYVEITHLPETLGFNNTFASGDEPEENLKKIEFLKETVNKVEGKSFSGKIILNAQEEEEIIKGFPLDATYKKFYQISRDIEQRNKIQEKLSSIRKELSLIKDIPVIPQELFSMKLFSFSLFLLPVKRKSPDNILSFKVEEAGQHGQASLYLIIFPIEKKNDIIRHIEDINGTILQIKRWNRFPSDILKKITQLEENNRTRIKELHTRLKEISSMKYPIFVFYDYALSVLQYLKARKNTGISKFVKGLRGWIKEHDVPRIESLLNTFLPDGYLYLSNPDANDEIPIALENKRGIEPFEVVTDLYGKPVYNNLDPSPHLSIFFLLSFAFCITDAAYGIILIIASLLLMKKFKYAPGIIKFSRLILYSGIATIFMGVITGSWFGDMLSRIPAGSLPVETLKKLVILNPLEGGNSAFIFLGWALILGYIQIIWGLYLNLSTSLKHHGFKNSGEPFSLLIIQVLVALIIVALVTSKNTLILPLSSILVFFFIYLMILTGMTQKGFFMRIFWAVYSAYSVIASNLLGDILSYSRLFGLGLTTAVLGFVINEMAFLLTGIPIVGYIIAAILFIVGHMANLGINLLGGYVHTSRLQYLEFFTKFFEGGGRPFSPLAEPRKYTLIK